MFDCIVLGLSVAGIAAALELAAAGIRVALVEALDEYALEEVFEMRGTPLSETPLSGAELSQVARAKLSEAGVELIRAHQILSIARDADLFVVLLAGIHQGHPGRDHHNLEARFVIYASNGGHPFPDPRDIDPSAWGRGATTSVWSDGSFFVGRPAAVVGNGCWAVEQALLMATYSSETTLLLAERVPPSCARLPLATANIRVEEETTVTSLRRIEDVDQIETTILKQGVETTRRFAAVVLADDPVPRTLEVVATEDVQAGIYRAGILNGYCYFDHSLQYSDGLRTAARVVAEHRRRNAGSLR